MEQDELPTLYAHSKRPQWGLAILAKRTPRKRRYLFQDGRLRAFAARFDHLIEPVDKPLDIATRVAGELSAQLDDGKSIRPVKRADRVSFAEQIAVFEHLHPGGFDDPDYIAKVRRDTRRRKRQREPLIADARRLLGRDALQLAIESGDGVRVRDGVIDLLGKCTVVRKRDQRPLINMPDALCDDFARALFDMLHGVGNDFDRFTRWVAALDYDVEDRATWPLVTSVPAMVDPERHIAVKRSVFRKQAAWMAPRLVVGKVPNAGKYQRVLNMAKAIRKRLEEAGHHPRDMWDIYDFVWMTLRPKNLKLLETEIDVDAIEAA